MHPKLLFIALVLIGLGCSNGVDEDRQLSNVSGRVMLEDTESTIPKVEIHLRDQTFKTVTNGKFSFTGIPAGVHEITAVKAGYAPHIDTLVVSSTIRYDIRLFRLSSPR